MKRISAVGDETKYNFSKKHLQDVQIMISESYTLLILRIPCLGEKRLRLDDKIWSVSREFLSLGPTARLTVRIQSPKKHSLMKEKSLEDWMLLGRLVPHDSSFPFFVVFILTAVTGRQQRRGKKMKNSIIPKLISLPLNGAECLFPHRLSTSKRREWWRSRVSRVSTFQSLLRCARNAAAAGERRLVGGDTRYDFHSSRALFGHLMVS